MSSKESKRTSNNITDGTQISFQKDTQMKVLFLDIDGVLNSSKFIHENQEKIINMTSLLSRGTAEIDPICLTRIRKVVETTGCQIVISSSWRILHPLDEIKDMLKELGWEAPIIDITPRKRSGIRGDEVKAWLNDHLEVKQFACVDDDSDFHPDQNLVQTSWENGILDSHVEMLINILK
jgi:hypothetical protein